MSEAEAPSKLAGRRLLMVAPSSSTHTHRWSRYFVSRGMTVQVISPFADPIEGVRVVQFPGRRRWYHWLKGLHLYIDYLRWRRIVREFGPDIVHVHYTDGGSRNRFYYNGVKRLIVSTWGSDVVESPEFPLSEKQKAGVRALLARADVVTATTRFLADVTARYCPPGKPTKIIPFGVGCDLFTPKPRPTDGTARIGFVKNLERKYGPEVLIEAMATIAASCPNARLIMCGKGPMAELLQGRVRELGLADKVEFPGRLPHEQVVGLIQSLDLMVMPSTCQESFGVAAIEASACGVPVVATRVGGVGEAVVDGETGLLVSPGDAAALAEACISLISDPARRTAMGGAGRAFVLEHYQWYRNAAEMEKVYEELLTLKK